MDLEIKNRERVYVKTPQGNKFHGEILEMASGIKHFYRTVSWERDRMRIFDAWAINPDAFEKIRIEGVDKLWYVCSETSMAYWLDVKDLAKMLIGELRDDLGRKLAWEAEFAGGKTIYIKVDAFNNKYKNANEKK